MQNRSKHVEKFGRPAAMRVLTRQRDMQPQRMNINALLVEMTPTLEHVFGVASALEVACDQDLPPIVGAPNMVKLALMDLCAAARSTVRKGERLIITATVKVVDEAHAGRVLEAESGEFVCLSVRHKAAPNSNLDNDVANSMASVYGIAQQHCGWLEVSRDADNHTSFDLYFPVRGATQATELNQDRTVEIPGGSETILLVEDELDLLSLTRDILERYGYRIITAPNGVAALKIWRERHHEIDLLVTDVRMPEGISGHELAQRLRSEKPALKVVFVSGYSIESSSSATAPESSAFLTKPFTPPGLAQAVRRALGWQDAACAA